MISIPTWYPDEYFLVTTYRYYGNFVMHVAERNRLKGMYGLTVDLLDQALAEYGGRMGKDTIDFDDERMSTMFILRWS